jgi:cytoskeletal protein CcmA (bactofilin family)
MGKISKIVAGVVVLSLAVMFVPLGASAVTIEEAEGVVSENYDDDVILGGNNLTVSGEVQGDLVAAGGFVRFDGSVTEDLMLAGGMVTVAGKVGDDARLAGGNVTVEGEIADDLIVAGATVILSSSATVGGDLVVTGGTVMIDGVVDGKVRATGGNLVLSGSVGGDVWMASEDVIVKDTAVVSGDFGYESFREAEIDEGATISGEIDANILEGEIGPGSFGLTMRQPSYSFTTWVMIPWVLILGAILLAKMPRKTRRVVEKISEKPGASIGWGLLFAIVAPIVGVLLVVTVVALPLGVITLAVLTIGWILGGVAISIWVGRWILGLFKREGEVSWGWSLVIGGIVLPILIAIPIIGWLIWLVAMLFGFGAIVVTMKEWRKMKKEKSEGELTDEKVVK